MSTEKKPVVLTGIEALIAQAVAFLKGGDEAKISKFYGKVGKAIKQGIKENEKLIKTLKDDIAELEDKYIDVKEDLVEELAQVKVEIDTDKISTSVGMTDYVEVYLTNVQAVQDKLENKEKEHEKALSEIQEEIKDAEAQIKKFKEILK